MQVLKYDWEFNILNIYNFRQFGNLKNYFEFIKNNYQKIEGDIVEAGVFQGRSLIATALLFATPVFAQTETCNELPKAPA